jgi:hypothetical protein
MLPRLLHKVSHINIDSIWVVEVKERILDRVNEQHFMDSMRHQEMGPLLAWAASGTKVRGKE